MDFDSIVIKSIIWGGGVWEPKQTQTQKLTSVTEYQLAEVVN